MQCVCVVCGRGYEAKRKDSRTCSATCRSNKRNVSVPELVESPLVRATRLELEAAGKLDTRLGQQAMVVAARMAVGSASGVGALSKELDRVIAAATGVPVATPGAASAPVGKGDEVDEVKTRRDAKRAAAG